MTRPPTIAFALDGEAVEIEVDPLTPLSSAIVETLGRRGVVEPCGVGACGGCTVLVDGATALGCLMPVGLVEGRAVTTITGIPDDDAVVAAFVAANAFQCGYCIPGFVLATKALRSEGTPPEREAIIEGLAGNLCRCSSYTAILEAAEASLEP